MANKSLLVIFQSNGALESVMLNVCLAEKLATKFARILSMKNMPHIFLSVSDLAARGVSDGWDPQPGRRKIVNI